MPLVLKQYKKFLTFLKQEELLFKDNGYWELVQVKFSLAPTHLLLWPQKLVQTVGKASV